LPPGWVAASMGPDMIDYPYIYVNLDTLQYEFEPPDVQGKVTSPIKTTIAKLLFLQPFLTLCRSVLFCHYYNGSMSKLSSLFLGFAVDFALQLYCYWTVLVFAVLNLYLLQQIYVIYATISYVIGAALKSLLARTRGKLSHVVVDAGIELSLPTAPGEDGDVCAICLEPLHWMEDDTAYRRPPGRTALERLRPQLRIAAGTQRRRNFLYRLRSCKHVFHTYCFDELLQQAANPNSATSLECPCCRAPDVLRTEWRVPSFLKRFAEFVHLRMDPQMVSRFFILWISFSVLLHAYSLDSEAIAKDIKAALESGSVITGSNASVHFEF